MRNILSIIISLSICINIVAKNAEKNTEKNPNNKNGDSIQIDKLDGFNFIYSQKHWRYSSFDSTYVDYINIINDTTYFNGDLFIQTHLLQTKLGFTYEEKLKIYLVSKKHKFILLPDYLKLKNIFYNPSIYKQTISIYFGNENYTISWDGIYPDLGNNEYVLKHRKFVDQYKELSDTIYSILIKKVELHELYNKSGVKHIPINVRGVSLKEIGFPKKQIPKIGRYNWGVIVSGIVF